jgi:hypothetical protein
VVAVRVDEARTCQTLLIDEPILRISHLLVCDAPVVCVETLLAAID